MPCRAEGRTALYDAILATSQEILKHSVSTKLLQHLLDDTKTRRFLLVVLTDGADVCSKHTLQETCEVLSQLKQAKELGLLKILFIGVQLEASAEAAMKRRTAAVGDCTSYVNVTSVEAIKRMVISALPLSPRPCWQFCVCGMFLVTCCGLLARARSLLHVQFHEIELSLGVGTQSATPQTSAKIDWNGLIGRHVRIVGHSKGLGNMYIGAIGVVQSQVRPELGSLLRA